MKDANIEFQSKRHGLGVLPMETLFNLTCFNSESVKTKKGSKLHSQMR